MRPAISDQFLNVRGGQRGCTDEIVGVLHRQSDWCEFFDRVIRRLLARNKRNDVATGGEEKGIPIRRSLHDCLSPYYCGCPWSILNNHRLLQGFAQLLAHDPGIVVGRIPRPVRHNDPDGAAGVVVLSMGCQSAPI